MEFINRPQYLLDIEYNFKVNPVVAILGPRQCGKTSLAREYIKNISSKEKVHYFDLEKFDDLNALSDSYLILSKIEGLIVIDEIQKIPKIFETIRVLVDDVSLKQRYLILGSASGELMQQSSETLAGRISYIELTPFNYNEVFNIDELWFRGGYPRSFLFEDDFSYQWRQNYILTFLNKDIPSLGISIAPANLRKFWVLLCSYHGCLINYQNIAKSLELTSHTVKKYAAILESTFMIRQLHPWHENISKRQVKSPKFYIRDSGLLHALLSIKTQDDLLRNSIVGNSWEGFMLEEIIRAHNMIEGECFFWRTAAGAELDLLFVRGNERIGFEFKRTQKVKLTPSCKTAMQDLKLDKLYVINPGEKQYPLAENIIATDLKSYLATIKD